MSLMGWLFSLGKPEPGDPRGERIESERELVRSEFERWALAQQQEKNRRGLDRLRERELALQVILLADVPR